MASKDRAFDGSVLAGAAAMLLIALAVGCTSAEQHAAPGRPSVGNTPLPCDVQQGLRLNCQTCHGPTPLAGVPMALVTWQDLQQPAVSNPQQTVAQLIANRINDAHNPMPPAPYTINPVVRQQLTAHVQAGNPPGGTDCGGSGTGGSGGVGGVGGSSGVGGSGGVGGDVGGSGGVGGESGTGGAGGVGGDGGTGEDVGTCYTFPVHQNSAPNDTTPYTITGQHYSCFYFDMPWPAGSQGVRFKSKFDSHPELVHHWLVYLDENDNQPNGTVVSACSGSHPSSPTMVAGWAAGADNYALPPDVGLKLDTPNRKLLIEFHWYLPPGSPPVQSTSAVEICTAATPRPNTATISFLGSESISVGPGAQAVVSGSCTPQADCIFPGTIVPLAQDITIVRSWPHMHKLGYRMDSHIIRANGQREQLFDELFSFDNQISYPTPAVIHPGDRIETRCYFQNDTALPVSVGYNTQDEMCFNFMTAYPADALKSRSPLGCTSSSFTGTSVACLF